MNDLISLKNYFNDKDLNIELEKNYHISILFLTNLVYYRQDLAKSILFEHGIDRCEIFQNNNSRVLLLELDNYCLVGFKGTENLNWSDLKKDLSFWKRSFKDIKAHSGFVNALTYVYDDVIRNINFDKEVIYFGHSMGGALATLLSIISKPDHLCTFGAPKVSGGNEYVKYFEDISYDRIITKYDWIKLLPPSFLMYEHPCKPIVLNSPKNPFEAHKLQSYNKEILRLTLDKQ